MRPATQPGDPTPPERAQRPPDPAPSTQNRIPWGEAGGPEPGKTREGGTAMSERFARKARREAIQYALDRAAASWTMHRLHPDEGWDCAAQELQHLAHVLQTAPPRSPDQEGTTP